MTAMHRDESPAGTPGVRHETSDVNIRAILLFGLGLLVSAIVIHLLVWRLFWYFENREDLRTPLEFPMAAGQGNRLPPKPRLQTNPREDLRALRADEDAILGSYALDKATGVVRIPIEQAMRLVVERGLPAREEHQEKNGQR